jgi:hypothetical protein
MSDEMPDHPTAADSQVEEPVSSVAADSETETPLESPPPDERSDAEVSRTIRRMTRRSFVTAALVGGTGYVGWKWMRTRPAEGGLPRPLRRILRMNERLSLAYFGGHRLAPEFPASAVARPARINGRIGLDPKASPADWKLELFGVAGATSPVTLTMIDIRALPPYESTTELKCIEGWSQVVQWKGARLADLLAKFRPPTRDGSRPEGELDPDKLVRYVSLETPGRQYYVGLDMLSALHPQTLLAYEMNGAPLSWAHGAPLRLAIPVKYGIKNIKRITVIRYSDERPADFWGDRGYDWYAGM